MRRPPAQQELRLCSKRSVYPPQRALITHRQRLELDNVKAETAPRRQRRLELDVSADTEIKVRAEIETRRQSRDRD